MRRKDGPIKWTNQMDKKIEHKIKNVFTSSVSNENKDTGCTLIYFPDGGVGCVDVRGGSVRTTWSSMDVRS